MDHAIQETVGCFAAPQVCDRILEAALSLSPWSAVPEDIGDARAFIEGALRMALVHFLDEHAAEAVVTDLEAVLTVRSGLAPVPAAALVTVPPPPGEEAQASAESAIRSNTHVRPRDPARLPRLFVVSPRFDAAAIVDRFGDAVACVRTFDIEQTVNSLRLLDGAEAVLLVDGALAMGRGDQVAALIEPFRSQVFVTLWDAPGSDAWEMEHLCATAGWAYLPAEADSASVIAFLARFIR